MTSEYLDTIVAIDIGTTKVCTVVAQKGTEQKLELVAFGASKSEGLKKGSIVDLEKAIISIKRSVEKAQEICKFPLREAVISIAGGNIYSFNHSVMVALRTGEVTRRDLNRALGMANAVTLPNDRKILHVIPQHFKVDDVDHIKNPLGMNGRKLTMGVHIVTGPQASIQNLSKCVVAAGVQIQDIVLQPIASSEAVLTQEEKEMGTVLVDIGGGTTDLVVWQKGVPVYSRVIPIGGNHFTYDLMMGLHITQSEAENIKKNQGTVLAENIPENLQIKLQSSGAIGPKDISVRFVSKVLGLRAEELLLTIKSLLDEKKLQQQIVRYVFTGGGSLIRDFNLLAQYILERENRIGHPFWLGTGEQLKNPQLSTVVGLLNLVYRRQTDDLFKQEVKQWVVMKKLNESLKNVFKEIF